LTKLAVK